MIICQRLNWLEPANFSCYYASMGKAKAIVNTKISFEDGLRKMLGTPPPPKPAKKPKRKK